ncbi:MAG: phosphatase PAP2 family protein [Candidatus Azobacteroides sp.]|nr:phosphatase PAP2 family protein [Candidatus Azobacteroides sp.]
MLEQELQWEKNIFRLLNGSESTFWDNFFWLYSSKWIWVPFYLCLFIVFAYKKKGMEIALIFLSVAVVILLCDQIASGFFKPVFHRFRPSHHPDFQDQVAIVRGYRGGRYGFISSHAANAFGFATFLALVFRNRLFTFVMLLHALLTGYSRIYLGVHFISDIVAGSLLGIAIGYAIYLLFNQGRIHFLSVNKADLKRPLYSIQRVYLIGLVYLFMIIILLLFSSQIINLIYEPSAS